MPDITELVTSLLGQQPQMFDTFGGPKGGMAIGHGYTNMGKTLDPYEGWAKEQPPLNYMQSIGNIPMSQRWLAENPGGANIEDRRYEHKNLGGYKELIEEMDKKGLSHAPAVQAFLQRRGAFNGPVGNKGVPLPQPNPLRQSGLLKDALMK